MRVGEIVMEMKPTKFKSLMVLQSTHKGIREMCADKGTKIYRELAELVSYHLAAHRALMRQGPKLAKLNRKAQ